ncbi:putative surface protein with fasciclin (FAS1) repeats [Undibacterium sp. GrIS 1.2]|uniref:fasciclin domain-containing protein n=1 Tax=Undibacterium sp. GrIS 1.2 TaxID=3143933 RepID=UPI00339B53A1
MNTLIDVVIPDGHFKTLAKSFTAVGFIDAFKGAGRFTVFAPTDNAFAKLPPGTVDALLKDKAKLKSMLTYHVVSGKVMSTDLKAGNVKTVQGSEVMASTMDGAMVNGAKVAAAHRAFTWTQQRG